ncbi:1281_t:CDS:10 [Acaulospora morrowiae]|uniref:1281_t:CDS:1 n=1 Tax=Acaulospora morrowiae TaxID=94023 RepID=A0A9N9GV21_9GLOM|nr:1281_t:CDS:10 [Acaulospora morrowiae]
MSPEETKKEMMSNAAGELRVEVNQRRLIFNMLARYPSEFVVYRGLLQNAGSNLLQWLLIFLELTKILLKDDAKASSVKISFKCDSPDISKKCERIVFKNNGFAFRPQDWNRLKKIAEGNPDEQKIGAFGVGFYSLFSKCEEPFVSSGGQAMVFYWCGDQLFAKFNPKVLGDSEWTTFLMELRKPSEVPDLTEFSRFLVTSLGFTVNLREILVYCNDLAVIHISKQMGSPRPVEIQSNINRNSPLNMFKLKSIDMRGVLFSIRRMVFPTGASPFKSLSICSVEKDSIRLRIVSGDMDVNIKEEFIAEMERITKKKPPSQTTMQLIFSSYDDIPKHKTSYAFSDLLQYSEQGRVFIGFRTHQTTGCFAHLAARVIPTVERESIDLAEKTLAVYNSELLGLSGVMFRILYEHEMNLIGKLYGKSGSDRALLERRAVYTLSSSKLSILSTHGVRPINAVRLLSPEMSLFIKTIPSVPKSVLDCCIKFFMRAKDITNQIYEATIEDVFLELKSRTMNQDEMADLMKWWILYFTHSENKNISSYLSKFLQLAAVRVGNNLLLLKNVLYYINPSVILADMDLPPSVLPHSISKKIKCEDFQKFFGKWTEFTLVRWIRYIAEKQELENDPQFNEKFWKTFSRRFDSMNKIDKVAICNLLSKKKFVPTKFGLKKPAESYFPEVTLFSDLPTVQMSFKVSEKVFTGLGVRDHVELQFVLDRLVNPKNLDHMELVKYFGKLMKDKKLTTTDIIKLKTTEIWIAEQPRKDSDTGYSVDSASKSQSNVQRYRAESSYAPQRHRLLSLYAPQRYLVESLYVPQRYRADSLYAPQIHNRELGLPIIQWDKRWYSKSDEAKFLIDIGLNEHPPLQVILKLASPITMLSIRDKALKYFVENFKNRYSQNYNANTVQFKFLPCTKLDVYAKPLECFSNPECDVMGFNVLRQDLRFQAEELGIKQHPSGKQLIDKLLDPPKSVNDARSIFNYLASRQGDFDHWDWKKLGTLKFIPIQNKGYPYKVIHKSPRNCFFKSSEEIFSEFFFCIDFGERANRFLEACGTKNKPTIVHFAEFLVESSQIFWNKLKNTNDNEKKYATVLENISRNLDVISEEPELLDKMKRSPILICSTQGIDNKTKSFNLDVAAKIFINDKDQYKQIFNPPICPFDDAYVVALYKALGCRSLNESVMATPQIDEEKAKNSFFSDDVREIISKRIPLYYDKFENGAIKKDENWLRMLIVKEINQITIKYEFQNIVEYKSAYASFHPNNRFKLYITRKNGDLYFPDIAMALVEHIHKKSSADPSRMIVMLTSSLEDLQRIGYSSDRGIKGIMNTSAFVESNQKQPDRSDSIKKGMHKKLSDAIKSCRSNSRGAINGQGYKVEATNNSTYCDVSTAQSLEYVGNEGVIEIYVAKGSPNILTTTMIRPLKSFSTLLIDIADIFGLEHNRIHIFYEKDTTTVAFNCQSTLFFNLKTYIESHYFEGSKPSIEAMSSWFLTMCHELAHNLVSVHSAEHEQYLQGYAKEFMKNFINKLRQREIRN